MIIDGKKYLTAEEVVERMEENPLSKTEKAKFIFGITCLIILLTLFGWPLVAGNTRKR